MLTQMTLGWGVSLTVSPLAMLGAEWGAAPLALLEEIDHSTLKLYILGQSSV